MPHPLRFLHDGLGQDLRYAVRALRRSPGFTLTAVATLALGIGVNVAVFTVTNAVLFKGFRLVENNDRIVYVDTRDRGRGCCVSYPDFQDWRAQATSFEGMGAVADLKFTLNDDDGYAEGYDATQITAGAFRLLGRSPILGRGFEPADETPGAAPAAILTYRFWDQRYGKDTTIVGRTIRINNVPTTVIGVMPRGFSFPQNQDLWLPLIPTPEIEHREARGMWFAFGRLAEGATLAGARAEMETIGRRLESAYPNTNEGLLPAVHSFSEFFIGPDSTAIYGAMLGAVCFVLLIACANLANLLLARAVGRSRELSVRIALGAGRGRIVRQLLIESLLLSGVGGLAGWWVAGAGVRVYELAANPPSWFADVLDYTADYRVFAYCILISVGTGLLFGLAPALRLSKLDVNAALKEGGRGSSGAARGKRLSSLLVVGEMALAVMLLAGAGVMIRSFLNIYNADLGVKTDDILTALLKLPADRYPQTDSRISFFDQLETRLQAAPGVESVALADSLPAAGTRLVPYDLADAPSVDMLQAPKVSTLTISPAYFRTMRAPLVLGRAFDDRDRASAVPVAIVNQRFANEHWPGGDPLGKRLKLLGGTTPNDWLTVVGVAPNIVQDDSTGQRTDPLVYVPFQQRPAQAMWIMARTRVRPGGLAAELRREVRALDPDLPVWLGPFSLDERLALTYRSSGLSGALFAVFAAVALLLAAVGLYAVIAYSVSRRTQEIGVRMAIGGTRRDILRLVYKQGMRPLAIGLGIGLAGSFAVNRVLESQLVQVSPADPLTLVVASVVLIFAAGLGCSLPARRAMRVDPVIALRHE